MRKGISCLFFFILNFLYSYERFIDFDLIKKAGPPKFVEDGILFTVDKNEGNVIYLRTDIDLWKKDYYFKKSEYGVFYLFLPIRSDIKKVKYRINIDGYWTIDPYNTNVTEDVTGILFSVVEVSEETFFYRQMPVIEYLPEGVAKVYFRYKNPNANDVIFVCSQDNWSLFSNIMKKGKNGYWEIEKYFSKGRFYYYFLVDGKKVIDIENKERAWDLLKGEVSVFTIK